MKRRIRAALVLGALVGVQVNSQLDRVVATDLVAEVAMAKVVAADLRRREHGSRLAIIR